MNDVTVTVSGFAGNDPALHVSKDREWATFRVASTRRYLSETDGWTDGATLWFTVKAWRAAAQNVARSVRKGNPVVVTGRLEVDEWTGPDDQQRMGLVINASAVGVDATRGKVEFARMYHHDAASENRGQGGPGAGTPGDSGGMVAVPPGEPDRFAVDVPGDGTDHDDEESVGQRELVNA